MTFRGITGALASLAIVALAIWLFLREPEAPPPAPPPQPAALARLTRGVNLSNWLQHGPPTEAARYAPDAADWQRMRALGLDHARILVDPAALLDDRGLPRAKAVDELRKAVEGALGADLLVVLALQLPDDRKAALIDSAPARAALAGTWRWLAGMLAHLPASQLAFEPLNEPVTTSPGGSRALMRQLVAELRAVAPRHTLVVTGHGYAGIAELEALAPLAEANLVYGFHFYEPHNFTHQGATWGNPAWEALRNFPYPSSPESVAGRMGSVPPAARDLLRWHGDERWNRARIGKLIERAAQWSRRHQLPVWCSEFGALKGRVGADDRAAWLSDVRVALEERGIGWAHWDYAGPFGMVSGPRGKRVADQKTIEALGLKGE